MKRKYEITEMMSIEGVKDLKRQNMISGNQCYEDAEAELKRDNFDEALMHCFRGVEENLSYTCLHSMQVIVMKMRWSDKKRSELEEKAAAGDISSIFFLAYCVYYGSQGFAMNLQKSYSLYKEAAEGGHAIAMRCTGRALRHGRGVEEDEAEALKWFVKAANRGESQSAELAAEILYDGAVGVPKDIHRAALMFQLGAFLGQSWTIDRFETLLRVYGEEVAPWSRWMPYPLVQMTQTPKIHASQLTWTLISQRLQHVPKGVALMVSSYISTRVRPIS